MRSILVDETPGRCGLDFGVVEPAGGDGTDRGAVWDRDVDSNGGISAALLLHSTTADQADLGAAIPGSLTVARRNLSGDSFAGQGGKGGDLLER